MKNVRNKQFDSLSKEEQRKQIIERTKRGLQAKKRKEEK